MTAFKRVVAVARVALAIALLPSVCDAQQVTGELGSPSATTTISGTQLPPPDPKFGGVIEEKASQSKAWWPPRVVPPKGAPNVLLIMTDDAGFGAPSTFGGVVDAPALDRIAKNGLRYTQFHSTSLCSPTRAALIIGGFLNGEVGRPLIAVVDQDSTRSVVRRVERTCALSTRAWARYKAAMISALRAVTVFLGIAFTLEGLAWLVDPASSARALGMPLLDGLARSTQIGDFAVFFLAAGGAILVGSRPGRARVLYFPAALIGGAAITRTLAWAFHGADFAALFIFVELLTGVVLLAAAVRAG